CASRASSRWAPPRTSSACCRRSSSRTATWKKPCRRSSALAAPSRRRLEMAATNATQPRHFLDLDRFDTAELRVMLDTAARMKRGEVAGGEARPLSGKTLAMIFEKPSTRTRVSFEVAATQLGGHAVVLQPSGTQLARGETAADTARVLTR